MTEHEVNRHPELSSDVASPRWDEHASVVLAYGDSPHLRECLASLRAQTVASHTIIASSTPSSYLEQMAKEFDVPLMINSQRSGIANDWSFGYRCANTRYVTLAHQDDRYRPHYVAAMREAARRHQDALILFSDYGEIIDSTCVSTNALLAAKRMLLIPFRLFGGALRNEFLRRMVLSFGSPIPCPAVTFHKERIGPFEFSTDYQINMDWDAWIRLAARPGAFVSVPAVLLEHRIHEESATTAGIRSSQRAIEDRRMFARLLPGPFAAVVWWLYRISYSSNSRAAGG